MSRVTRITLVYRGQTQPGIPGNLSATWITEGTDFIQEVGKIINKLELSPHNIKAILFEEEPTHDE